MNPTKFFLIFLLHSFLSLHCTIGIYAQQVKILKCNTPTVNIGGKDLSAGDTFEKSSIIRWSSKNQVVIIRNSDGRIIRIAASHSEDGKQDIISKLLQKQYTHFSSRGDEFPGGCYYMEDSLAIPIDLEEWAHPELELLCTIKGQAKIYKPLLSENGKYAIIHNDIFQVMDEHKIECKLIGTINGEAVDLSDLMVLIPIDFSLEEK